MNYTYLLIPEAAEIARVSESTIRHWINIKRLPSSKPGRRVLIRSDVLTVLLDGGDPWALPGPAQKEGGN